MRTTAAKRFRTAKTDAERFAIAFYGKTHPERFEMVEPYLATADYDRRHKLDPKRPCRLSAEQAERCGRIFLAPLIDGDAEFFEQVARGIRFFKQHKRSRASEFYADPLRVFLTIWKASQDRFGSKFSVQSFRERAPLFENIEDRQVRRIAKEVGLVCDGKPGRPRKQDTERKRKRSVS